MLAVAGALGATLRPVCGDGRGGVSSWSSCKSEVWTEEAAQSVSDSGRQGGPYLGQRGVSAPGSPAQPSQRTAHAGPRPPTWGLDRKPYSVKPADSLWTPLRSSVVADGQAGGRRPWAGLCQRQGTS